MNHYDTVELLKIVLLSEDSILLNYPCNYPKELLLKYWVIFIRLKNFTECLTKKRDCFFIQFGRYWNLYTLSLIESCRFIWVGRKTRVENECWHLFAKRNMRNITFYIIIIFFTTRIKQKYIFFFFFWTSFSYEYKNRK